MNIWIALPLTFLVGGIPFGWLAVRVLRGIDVRTVGSGNIGATNAARCFAGRSKLVAFFGIYALDFLKGYLPVAHLTPGGAAWHGAGLAAAAVLGHCFTPYLGFKGGKGVATGCGVVFALEPLALVVAVIVFAAVLAVTRVVALGSISLGFALACTVILREPSTAFGSRMADSILCIALALFLVWTHRSNIRRLVALHREGKAA